MNGILKILSVTFDVFFALHDWYIYLLLIVYKICAEHSLVLNLSVSQTKSLVNLLQVLSYLSQSWNKKLSIGIFKNI